MHKGKERTGQAPAPAEVVTRSQPLRLPARDRRVPEEQRFPCPEGCGWGTRGSRGGLSLILAEQMAQGRDVN